MHHNQSVNPDEFLPDALRPPARGDTLSFSWTADIGAGATVGTVSEHLRDLQVVLDLGQRWGLIFAEQAAAYAFEREVSSRGPVALREAISEWPGVEEFPFPFIEEAFLDRDLWYRRSARRGWYGASPDDLVRLLSSRNVPSLLGQPISTRHIEYNNPVEVVLFGAGFVLVGTVKLLRMIRDWSSQRRVGDAIADTAESAARRNKTASDLGAWLVDEARAGRQQVPIGELMKYVTPTDLESIARLADSDVQLQLPEQLSGQ
ncbi:MAG: hypothetical protein DLM61_17730 [Pseudonocardiales bacterium]|nr:MAG: hypothetical protein DLM61_17730 [Pseudonocardiales bacterium]